MLYGVELTKLRQFYGSKDEATLAAIFEASADEIADINDRFADRIDDFDDEWPMTEDVLAEMCAGICRFDNAGPMYGYALEIICRYFGEDILDDDLGPLKMHPYKSALLEGCRYRSLQLKTSRASVSLKPRISKKSWTSSPQARNPMMK